MSAKIITQPGDHLFNVGANERLDLNLVILGQQTKPFRCIINLIGEGADVRINGIFLGKNTDHSQLDCLLHHKSPHTTARLSVKGVLKDKASAIFTGLIKIDPKAQNTDSFLEHRTIMLSNQASVHPVPSLEIEADQVKASHAVTVSRLDEEEKFYLETRGIDEQKAEEILIQSFISPETRLLAKPWPNKLRAYLS